MIRKTKKSGISSTKNSISIPQTTKINSTNLPKKTNKNIQIEEEELENDPNQLEETLQSQENDIDAENDVVTTTENPNNQKTQSQASFENTLESYLDFLFQEGLKFYFGYDNNKKDYAKARNFFEMATKNGHAPSKFFLGDMYWMGFDMIFF